MGRGTRTKQGHIEHSKASNSRVYLARLSLSSPFSSMLQPAMFKSSFNLLRMFIVPKPVSFQPSIAVRKPPAEHKTLQAFTFPSSNPTTVHPIYHVNSFSTRIAVPTTPLYGALLICHLIDRKRSFNLGHVSCITILPRMIFCR